MSQRQFPPQQQPRPGHESAMRPRPETQESGYHGSGKLQGKVALITGADSGIGHAVAVAFAKEGADVAIVYLNSHEDANKVKQEVEQEGRRAVTIAGDIGGDEELERERRNGSERSSERSVMERCVFLKTAWFTK